MILDTILSMVRSKRVRDEHFMVTAVFGLLPGPMFLAVAGQALTVPLTFQADSDFIIESTMMTAMSAPGVPIVAPDMLLSLFDSGSGRVLQDVPVHVGNCTGTALWPYRWEEPRLFKGGGTMAVVLIDLFGQPVTTRVDITFAGRKVFYLADYTRSI
jgi:hypothetical protein